MPTPAVPEQFFPTALDREMADMIARIMREDHAEFRETAYYVLTQYRIYDSAERHEHLRNIGHLLGKRQKPRLNKIADEVSSLIHQGFSFSAALRRVLHEYSLEARSGFYFQAVGKNLSNRRKRDAEKTGKDVRRSGLPASLLPRFFRNFGPPLQLTSVSLSEVQAEKIARREKRRQNLEARAVRPKRQRSFPVNPAQGKLF